MDTYQFVTIAIAIFSIVVSAVLTFLSIRSSNKSTRLLSRAMRENSRMINSEHLSLYRIEAFYNAVAIRNLEFDIRETRKKLQTAKRDKKVLEEKLRKLQMNLEFMKIREAKLIRCDFVIQRDMQELWKELKTE